MKKHKDLISIGQQIRSFRERKGFSQEEFANHIEINRGYYGTVERGEANITLLNLLKIAKGLKVAPGDLFPLETYKTKEK